MSPYYTRDLNPRCQGQTGYCRRPAKVEVFNTHNASMGKFCDQCAKDAIHCWKADDLRRERENVEANKP